MIRPSRAVTLALAALLAGPVAAQDVKPAEAPPTVDLNEYIRNGLNPRSEYLVDNPRYPAITTRVDRQNSTGSFSTRLGGDTHRMRASNGRGLLSLFGFD